MVLGCLEYPVSERNTMQTQPECSLNVTWTQPSEWKAFSKISRQQLSITSTIFFPPQILVVLTDGASTGGEKSLRVPLENLKQSYVNIYAIGIGRSINKRELEMMATPPVKEHVYYVATMQELQTLLTNIGESACKSKCIPGALPY